MASQRDDNTMNMSPGSGNQSRTVPLWKFYRDLLCLTGGKLGEFRFATRERGSIVRRTCPIRVILSNRQELPENRDSNSSVSMTCQSGAPAAFTLNPLFEGHPHPRNAGQPVQLRSAISFAGSRNMVPNGLYIGLRAGNSHSDFEVTCSICPSSRTST